MRGDKVHCRYAPVSPQADLNVTELKKLAKQASLVILATDQDREGEGISYHLKEALSLKNFQRITYNEVTEAAIKKAIASPRQLDNDLVSAALARACLDKIQEFKPEPYWTVWVDYQSGFRAYFKGDGAARIPDSENSDGNERDDSEASDSQKVETARVSTEARALELVEIARSHPHQEDPSNLPKIPPKFKSKKNAQEAHEAIRPTDLTKPSTQLKVELEPENFAVYELIWRRAMASQCNRAKIEKTRITSLSGEIFWLARGQVLKFAGYTRYWKDFGGDSELPQVRKGDGLRLKKADSERKMTQPPPRYSEAKLVQVMERQGIGRPSTYTNSRSKV